MSNLDKVKMNVTMEVTKSQALALKDMFEYWNELSNAGSSRNVSFFIDGDGNFHPNCKIEIEGDVPELDDKLRQLAVSEDIHGDRMYDFDNISWYFSQLEENK